MSQVPGTIGKYRVIRRLGEGGMGAVYLAHDDAIDRHVAIKVIRTEDESLRRRFRSEAQSAGRLKHANIVTIYEFGEFEGGPYLAMEFIEGRTLRAVIEQHDPLSIADRLALLVQGCQGLAYAHRFGVVHRDIKPTNLMVDTEGVLKIVDFGIARTSGRDLTVTGKIVGTPAYMAPEQLEGDTADHRADIFSMGLVVFELLSGKCAYTGDSDYAIVNRIVNGTPNPFAHHDKKLEWLMQPVLARAMAKSPDARYQTADVLGANLAQVRSQLEARSLARDTAPDPSTQQTIILEPARRWRGRATAVAAIGVVATIGAGALWVRTARNEGAVTTSLTVVPEPQAVQPAPTQPQNVSPPVAAIQQPPPTPPQNESPAPRQQQSRQAEARQQEPRPPKPAADPKVTARLAAARQAEESGNYEAAIAAYQDVLAAEPQHAAAIDGLSSSRRGQARLRDAAVKKSLTDAEQKLAEGAYDEAIAIFESVLQQDAANPDALNGVARARKAKAAEDAVFKARAKKPPPSV